MECKIDRCVETCYRGGDIEEYVLCFVCPFGGGCWLELVGGT